MNEIMKTLINNEIIQLVILAVVIDTIFGIGRAIREKKFNSCLGINGAIRKIAMIVCVVFCALIDTIININLIGFLPDGALEWMQMHMKIESIGLAWFFGILFVVYEVVSILKNMTLCGLPVKFVFVNVRNFLLKYTDELPDDDEITNTKESDTNENFID